MKVCSKCKLTKDLSQYSKNGEKVSGYRAYCKACAKVMFNRWRSKNIDKEKKRSREYRINNFERVKTYNKRWQDTNREYSREWRKANRPRRRVYERKIYYSDPQLKIKKRIRHLTRYALLKNPKRSLIPSLVGCSIDELRQHLEKQFKPGMNWQNFKTNEWHIDHITPFANYDLTDPDQLAKACHYTNLQPLWASENIKKNRFKNEQ